MPPASSSLPAVPLPELSPSSTFTPSSPRVPNLPLKRQPVSEESTLKVPTPAGKSIVEDCVEAVWRSIRVRVWEGDADGLIVDEGYTLSGFGTTGGQTGSGGKVTGRTCGKRHVPSPARIALLDEGGRCPRTIGRCRSVGMREPPNFLIDLESQSIIIRN
jgi:hypothetical protein